MIQNIAVIGAGIMGSGIVQALAMGDKHVKMYDISEESLQKLMELSPKAWVVS